MEGAAGGRIERRRRIAGQHDTLAGPLVSAIPTPDPDAERARQRIVLPGDPPSPLNPPAGCAFHPRCPYAGEKCKVAVPPLVRIADGREVACILVEEISSLGPV